MNFYCLMTSGVHLTEEMCYQLYHTAAALMERKTQSTARFRTESCEGWLTATGKYASLGTQGGHIFEGYLETEKSRGKIRFIADFSDAMRVDPKYGRWISFRSYDREEDDDAGNQPARTLN
jgi:hypothetical protein